MPTQKESAEDPESTKVAVSFTGFSAVHFKIN